VHTRNLYMNRMKPFIDKPVIKVITGLRRSGKSCFMRFIMEYLRNQGIRSEQIVYIKSFNLIDFFLGEPSFSSP